jgi:RecA-family ATPase
VKDKKPNPNLKIALKYAALGWKLFPAKWRMGKHKPFIKWGVNASSDPDTITKWAEQFPNAYFCVACKASNITVLDIDNKDDTNKGNNSLFDLEMEYGDLPETLRVATPSKGFHHVFRGPTPMSIGKLGKGIDTPVMIPLPGTTIKGKGEYFVLEDLPLAFLPEWIEELLETARVKKERKEEINFELDSIQNQANASQYLHTLAPTSIQGDGGDLTAFQVACKVRDEGISEEKCLELMLEDWNGRCEPPWAPEELQKKVNNAYQYAQEPIGRSTPQADFTAIPLPNESAEETISHVPEEAPQLIHIKAFSGTPPKRQWLVEGLLPKNEVSAIYGAGGMGKSWLATQLALNVASGKGEFLEFPIKEQMPTLIISYEDKKEELHRRIHSIKRAPEYEFLDLDIPFWVCPMVGENGVLGTQMNNLIHLGVFLASLKQKIEEVKGKEKGMLLILDTLSDIFAINENDRQAASYCIKTILGGLIKEHGCTILIIAHPSKSSTKDKTFSSGSTGWHNSFRNVLALGPHENENLKSHRMFYQIKSNYTVPFDPIILKWEQGRLLKTGEDMIVDLVHEKNVASVLELITEQCMKSPPTPLGLHPQKFPNYYKVTVINAAGGVIDRDLKQKIITELVTDEIVREVKGKSRRSENGLWPVSLLEKEDD